VTAAVRAVEVLAWRPTMTVTSQFLIAAVVLGVCSVFINARLGKPASAAFCFLAVILFLAAVVTP
jgi:hypothetical protein